MSHFTDKSVNFCPSGLTSKPCLLKDSGNKAQLTQRFFFFFVKVAEHMADTLLLFNSISHYVIQLTKIGQK